MMKKIVMVGLALILILIALASVGPIIGLIISVAIAYFSLKQFLTTDSTVGKVFWALVILICIKSIFANVPALAGIVAIVLLYFVYKKWNENKEDNKIVNNDPFTNFERQWEELNNQYIGRDVR